jgi:hypothetical protein
MYTTKKIVVLATQNFKRWIHILVCLFLFFFNKWIQIKEERDKTTNYTGQIKENKLYKIRPF